MNTIDTIKQNFSGGIIVQGDPDGNYFQLMTPWESNSKQ